MIGDKNVFMENRNNYTKTIPVTPSFLEYCDKVTAAASQCSSFYTPP